MGLRHALQSRRQRRADLLLALLAEKEDGRFGYDMRRLSGIRSAPMYAALDQLEREGLITTGWTGPHPQRRLYRITPSGRLAAARG